MGSKLLATVDYETGLHQACKKMNSTLLKRFFPFFKRSWRLIQQGNWLWFWTMPGFIMQRSGRFWKRKNRLELVYLPPYSPQLNIVEGLWNGSSPV
ncbi:transposase [Paenibacillus larvae]|nr:transposase [Paenibacillus larvae]MDT2193015.1 transposase [Paenibacillus larvae]